MEKGFYRGRWSQRAPSGTLLLLMCMFIPTLTLLQLSEEPKCPDGDYRAESGICCNKCSPGFKLVHKCYASNQRSNCTPCPESQYNAEMNYSPTCRSCRYCKKWNEIEVSPCERHRNAVCGCKDGFYKSLINADTFQCLKCRQCKTTEKVQQTCTPKNNTVCECKENHHRVNYKCELCKECTTECKHLCSASTKKAPDPGTPGEKYLANIIGGAATVALAMSVVFAVITYFVTKRSTKNKLLKSSSETSESSDDSQDSCERGLIYNEQHLNNSVEAVPQSPQSDPEPPNPPDCPQLEIKISDLIYTVLDMVPVLQVKQLMRSLGARDTDIERAELDYRSSREAHYQVLRMWAERESSAVGRGRRCGILHEPLLQELLDKLREMHLGRAAEELETKYGIQ
ncbi:tumor necrosis factor receptor superfamily member 1A isoform X2 [Notolabrus celidotus]|uniref:tumor necrosis factor receptor superfamily member 1A isoform X2 n=1 Tax=Notolabrus celidotus TaxID=1203425 RepID=UPI00148FA94C|nr:tumor necrosis factor receptor superfamily member 1A isoform X2 [Notolabrus celidotus]